MRDLVPFAQLKNVKNTHGEVILLVKVQVSACNFTKSIVPPWGFFSRFFFSVVQMLPNRAKYQKYTVPTTDDRTDDLFFGVLFFIIVSIYHKDFDIASKRYLPCSLCIHLHPSNHCLNFYLYLNCFVLWL